MHQIGEPMNARVRQYSHADDYERIGRFLVDTYSSRGEHRNWLRALGVYALPSAEPAGGPPDRAIPSCKCQPWSGRGLATISGTDCQHTTCSRACQPMVPGRRQCSGAERRGREAATAPSGSQGGGSPSRHSGGNVRMPRGHASRLFQVDDSVPALNAVVARPRSLQRVRKEGVLLPDTREET